MAQNRYAKLSTSQLAKICNVSQGTVDRALHGRDGIRPETKEKILAAARAYGYLPDSERRSRGSALLGIVVFDLYNDSFSKTIMELEQHCQEEGYRTIVMLSHKDLQAERDCIRQLYHIGVDGIFLLSVGESADHLAFLHSLKLPVIAIGNRLTGFPYVGVDDYRAMAEVTEAVLAHGYRRLLYYAPVLRREGTQNLSAQALRYRGFADTCRDRGAIQQCFTDLEALHQALDAPLSTAVICPSDVYAAQVKPLLEGYKTKIGLIGFDNSPTAERLSFDSVETDQKELCRQLLLQLHTTEATEAVCVSHGVIHRGSL